MSIKYKRCLRRMQQCLRWCTGSPVLFAIVVFIIPTNQLTLTPKHHLLYTMSPTEVKFNHLLNRPCHFLLYCLSTCSSLYIGCSFLSFSLAILHSRVRWIFSTAYIFWEAAVCPFSPKLSSSSFLTYQWVQVSNDRIKQSTYIVIA